MWLFVKMEMPARSDVNPYQRTIEKIFLLSRND